MPILCTPGNRSISESIVLLVAALLKEPGILSILQIVQQQGKHPGAGKEATPKRVSAAQNSWGGEWGQSSNSFCQTQSMDHLIFLNN